MVVVDGKTDLPVTEKLIATVYRPDGSITEVGAYKDWLLRRTPVVAELEAFLLIGLEKVDIPEGSTVDIRLSKSLA
jgi:hypothetical protein